MIPWELRMKFVLFLFWAWSERVNEWWMMRVVMMTDETQVNEEVSRDMTDEAIATWSLSHNFSEISCRDDNLRIHRFYRPQSHLAWELLHEICSQKTRVTFQQRSKPRDPMYFCLDAVLERHDRQTPYSPQHSCGLPQNGSKLWTWTV